MSVRPGLLLVGGALAAAGLAWLWSVAGLLSDGTAEEESRGGVVEISPVTNRVLREVALDGPNDVETGLGSAWVTNNREGRIATVARIPAGPTGRPASTELAPATATAPDDLGIGEGRVWATVGDTAFAVDPQGQVDEGPIEGLEEGGLLTGVAVGAGAVWLADATRRSLSRLDPRTGRVTGTISLPSSPDGVAVGESSVWVPSVQAGAVLKIAPNLGRVVRAIQVPGAGSGVAVGAGSVWVAAAKRDAVARIEPLSGRVTWISVGDAPTDVAVSDGSAWVANSQSASVSRIEARTGEVTATVSVPRRPYRIAADGRAVWVTFLGVGVGGEPPP